MTLDQATTEFLTQMAGSGMKPIHEMTPPEMRSLGAGMVEMNGTGPDMLSVTDTVLTTADGASFTVRVLIPHSAVRGIVVYFHGGGWVTGTLAEFDTLARLIAHKSSSAVVLVDYRLAPEFPFPAAIDDAVHATRWALDHRLDITGDATAPVIVAGDSAGGNLAAVVAQKAAGDPTLTIARQVLIYPVVDSNLETPSYVDPQNQLLLNRDAMKWFFDHYAPDPHTRADVQISPLRATDVRDVPGAIVVTAEHDVLRSEVDAYAARLETAGVQVTLRHFAGQMHGFFNLIDLGGGQRDALDFVTTEITASLKQAYSPQTKVTATESEEIA